MWERSIDRMDDHIRCAVVHWKHPSADATDQRLFEIVEVAVIQWADQKLTQGRVYRRC